MSNAQTEARWLRQLANPLIFMYCCYWLMVLLVVGSIAQKHMGLFESQNLYFSSWFIFVFDYIPLPGCRLTLIITFFNLFAFLFTKRGHRQVGLAISHTGALLLLIGGFITAFTSTESTLMFYEGENTSTTVVQDYRELCLVNRTDENTDQVTAFAHGYLYEGAKLTHTSFTGSLHIQTYLSNCEPSTDGTNWNITEQPPKQNPSANTAGAILEVTDDNGTRTVTIFERMVADDMPSMTCDGIEYLIALRKEHLLLPFALRLIDGERLDHAGSGMAKSYKSVVEITTTDANTGSTIKREAVISMNEPLRLMGYTCYQQDFAVGTNGRPDWSALQVVRNVGQIFPYISSLIMCFGLLVHLVLHLPRLLNKDKKPAEDISAGETA